MKRHVLFAICLFLGCQNLQASDGLQPTTADSCALSPLMLEIFRKGALGKDPAQYETAAWIIRNSDGKLGLVFWPFTPRRNRQEWKGKIPSNMIALAHVHSVATPPRPSLRDKEAAGRIKAPIYTLHVNGIFRVMPTGKITQEAGRFWFNLQECHIVPRTSSSAFVQQAFLADNPADFISESVTDSQAYRTRFRCANRLFECGGPMKVVDCCYRRGIEDVENVCCDTKTAG